MKSSASNAKLNMEKVKQFETASQMSKRSLTRSELSKFFSEGKKKVNDQISERLSKMSKGSRLRNNLASKLQEKEKEKAPEEDR